MVVNLIKSMHQQNNAHQAPQGALKPQTPDTSLGRFSLGWFFRKKRVKANRVLPGFGLTLGYTLFYVSVVVIIPLLALVVGVFSLSWQQFWAAVSADRVVASYKLTITASLIAASINAVFGLLLAWVLVRYDFWGKKIMDALVDLPFALPTAVAGISLTALLAGNGWVGQYTEKMDIQLAFNPNGVVIALLFIGLPFVVRTVQPVLEENEKELEEAASSLGASRWQIFKHVIFPAIFPAWLTGFAFAFARGLGEYGSVIFIAGNMPMISEITPLIIIAKLEQYDYAGAMAVAFVMLLFSFVMLLIINALQAWQRRNMQGAQV